MNTDNSPYLLGSARPKCRRHGQECDDDASRPVRARVLAPPARGDALPLRRPSPPFPSMPRTPRFSSAVTRWSRASPGRSQPDPLPAGDPLDETFIDLDGASAQIFRLEPGAPPSAQLISAPPVFQVKARDVGQVFAIGLDGNLAPTARSAQHLSWRDLGLRPSDRDSRCRRRRTPRACEDRSAERRMDGRPIRPGQGRRARQRLESRRQDRRSVAVRHDPRQ